MSFRARLTSFFVLIVVMPMVAVAIDVSLLVDRAQTGKAGARAAGLLDSAVRVYYSSQATATADAAGIARALASIPTSQIRPRLLSLQAKAGLVRIGVRVNGRSVFDRGSRAAIAPGIARVRRDLPGSHGSLKVTVSELTASQFVRELSGPRGGLVVRLRGRTLAAAAPVGAGAVVLPATGGGSISVHGSPLSVLTASGLRGYGHSHLSVTAVVPAAAVGDDSSVRWEAIALIVGALVFALAFALLASRGLQEQVRGFLLAARRLGSGDFSSPIEVAGNDEFAALATEFNSMSGQLEQRIVELGRERSRLRRSLERIGQLFASNLDQHALLNLALQTAVDAVAANAGRLSTRATAQDPLQETVRTGSLAGFEEAVLNAEGEALRARELREVSGDDLAVAAVPLRPADPTAPAHGVLTVARRGQPFAEEDLELIRSLAAQATVALENVQRHVRMSRQAVTDQLTGLANRRRFGERLREEVEQVRRYHMPLSLILLDIDNFKSVNDTYGHQQGDLVLQHVARVVRDTSRDADLPARYGGEEMALVLPHTELEGAFAIAERLRSAIEALRVPRVDGAGALKVTASLGVAILQRGGEDELVADADAALYEAKRTGKNRTVRSNQLPANVIQAG